MPTTLISVAARRSMSWLQRLYADLPATLERTSERGDWSAKAVLISARDEVELKPVAVWRTWRPIPLDLTRVRLASGRGTSDSRPSPDGRRYVQVKAKGVGARALVFSTARRTPSLIVALRMAAM